MTQLSRTDWTTKLEEDIDSNGAGGVSALDLRGVFGDLRDSLPWFDEAVQTVNGQTGVDIVLDADDLANGSTNGIPTLAQMAVWDAGASGVADGSYGDITVAGSSWSIVDGVVTLAKIESAAKEGSGSKIQTTDGGLTEGDIHASSADGKIVAASVSTVGTTEALTSLAGTEKLICWSPANGNALRTIEPDVLGARVLEDPAPVYNQVDAGTKTTGSYTPTAAFEAVINGGAHSLVAPSVTGAWNVLYTNNGSAGALTLSGFTITQGDALTTTDGDTFMIQIAVNGSFKVATITAGQ